MREDSHSGTVGPHSVRARVDNAAESIGRVWPLYADVAANPLSGFEDLPFDEAVTRGEALYGGRGYPTADYFRRAWERGEIDPELLSERLAAAGIEDDPEALLDRMADAEDESPGEADDDPLDRLLSKWLAAFLDQGETAWAMPNREEGFYAAWSALAKYDADIPASETPVASFYRDRLTDLPDTAMEALYAVLADYPEERWEEIFEHHLAALPGWTGLIKQRERDENNPWQDVYPITLVDYLAVRLILAKHMGEPIAPEQDAESASDADEAPSLPAIWLDAWEESYRTELVDAVDASVGTSAPGPELSEATLADAEVETLADAEVETPADAEVETLADAETSAAASDDAAAATASPDGGEATVDADSESASESADDRPAAQLVFCIDTRSEIIRRHIEDAGPYETHGYAGFFGIPIRHEEYGQHVSTDSCPVMVDPKHRVAERPTADDPAERHDRWSSLSHAGHELMKSLKNDVAGAFGFVEGAGGFFGAALTARTLLPSRMYDLEENAGAPRDEAFCEPGVDHPDDAGSEDSELGTASPAADGPSQETAAEETLALEPEHDLPKEISAEQRADYAEAAFDLMGWDEFAPVVVFAGHASQTVNNPYESSIDCGACAGSSGVPNARVLAEICNDSEVRAALGERGHEIPEETVFVAAEHNTTTDEVTLFADEDARDRHPDVFERLERDLETARDGATAERVETIDGEAPAESARETERRAADWAEPRPEIGLSGNAGFVVGRRELTSDADLDGRAFLHTYDWAADPDGDALENIMVGPLVVVQMISAQYYFSTVDNDVYGSGTKVTHNPVGKVGVYQGNGGDIRMGLPFQSLHDDAGEAYHSPLRLTALLQAPVERVERILRENEAVRQLFDNGWLKLTVLDPERGNEPFHYRGDLEWESYREAPSAAATPASAD